MSSKLLRAVTLAAGLAVPLSAVVATSGTALAQGSDADKAAAKAAYNKGTTKYNLGEWNAAIAHFKTAFEAYPDASFLFNIAQSYRQAGDCKQGAFFYKRYLAIKPDASNKREVEGFIKDLNEECEKKAAAGITTPKDPVVVKDPVPPKDPVVVKDPVDPKDPATNNGSVGDGTQVADSGAGQDSGTDASIDVGGDLSDEDSGPKLLLAYASVGSAFMSIGDLETSPQLSFTVGGGYPLQMGGLTIDGGLLVSHTAVKWETDMTSGTAGFTAFLANVGVGMEVAPKIRVRGELGIGLMAYTGFGTVGNVFVDEGTMADGPLSSVAFRVAAGAEYAITDNLAVSAQPIVGNFSPAPSGIKSSIDNIKSFQLLLGVGYRM